MTSVLSKNEQLQNKFWEGLHTISSHETDFNNSLSLNMLFGLMQEAAYQHVKTLNFGWKDLYSKHLMWILSRIKIVINQIPQWEQDIRIRTWSTGTDGIIANRNWEVTDMQGIVMIAGFSNWLIMNEKSRRITRIDKNLINPHTYNKCIEECRLNKLPILQEFEVLGNITAKTSEIDINQHVNNTNYIKWIIDAEKFDFVKSHFPALIEINYLRELLSGQGTEIRKSCISDEEVRYAIFNGNEDSARIKVVWKE